MIGRYRPSVEENSLEHTFTSEIPTEVDIGNLVLPAAFRSTYNQYQPISCVHPSAAEKRQSSVAISFEFPFEELGATLGTVRMEDMSRSGKPGRAKHSMEKGRTAAETKSKAHKN